MFTFHLYLFECKFHFFSILFNSPVVRFMEISDIRLTIAAFTNPFMPFTYWFLRSFKSYTKTSIRRHLWN